MFKGDRDDDNNNNLTLIIVKHCVATIFYGSFRQHFINGNIVEYLVESKSLLALFRQIKECNFAIA